jgi:hypothetical protein
MRETLNMTVVTGPAPRNKRLGQTRGFSLPWDLSEWVSTDQLLDWTRSEVDSLDWDNPELKSYLERHPEFQPRFLLSLLVYAYAAGVCESDEIAGLYRRDDALRSAFPGGRLLPRDISRFRRLNRGLLKWGLAQVFKRALRSKLNLGDTLMPSGLRRRVIDDAVMRLDIARHMDRASQGA